MFANLATGEQECPIDGSIFSLNRFSDDKEFDSNSKFGIADNIVS